MIDVSRCATRACLIHTLIDYTNPERVSLHTHTHTAISISNVAGAIKSMQTSACDGEQLKIRCAEADYIIELLSAELTVLSPEALAAAAAASDSTNSCAAQPASNETCDAKEARAHSVSRENTYAMLKPECHLRPACTIDLRKQQLDSTNNSSKSASAKLTRLINERPCAANRKLLEVVYKCRPTKFQRRSSCKGAPLQLECPADRRLVIASAEYGSWPADARMNERCRPASEQQHNASSMPLAPPFDAANQNATANVMYPKQKVTTAQQQQQQQLQPQAPSCLSNVTSQAMNANCLHKQQCRFDEVGPTAFGDTRCPGGASEYVRVLFTCVNYNMLILSSGASSGAVTASTSSPTQLLTRNNISNFALMSNTSLSQYLHQSPTQESSLSSLPPAQQDAAASPTTSQSDDALNIITVVDTGKVSASRPAPQMSVQQRARLALAKYQPQVILMALVTSALFAIGLVWRAACARRASPQQQQLNKRAPSSAHTEHLILGGSSSSSSSASSTSSGATASTLAASKSHFLAAAAAADASIALANSNLNAQQQPAARKHNSCSESCFSLDEYAQAAHNAAQQQQQQQHPHDESSPGLDSIGSARPRLWTIYGSNRQQQQQPHYTATVGHQTLRPTRTFIGGSARAPMVSNTHTLQFQAHNSDIQQQQHTHHHLCHQFQAPLATSADLLLAINPSGAHVQPAPPPPPSLQSGAWTHQCALHQQQQQQQTMLPQHQHQQQQPSPMFATTDHIASPEQQCAFHQQQQQQQQMTFGLAHQLEMQAAALPMTMQQQQQPHM